MSRAFLLIAVLIVAGCSRSNGKPAAAESKSSAAVAASTQDEPPLITAFRLCRVFETELTGNQLYKGKVIRVKGTVIASGDENMVLLDTNLTNPVPTEPIECRFIATDKISKLRKNQAVIVIGTCTGLANGRVQMAKCKLIKP